MPIDALEISEVVTAFYLTLRLAFWATLLLLASAVPLCFWLVRQAHPKLKTFVQSSLLLPLVLPPSVLGFYLLILFSAQGALGQLWQQLTGAPLAFHFSGLVLAVTLTSIPIAIQLLCQRLLLIPNSFYEAAASLGATRFVRFHKLTLPLIRWTLVRIAVLSFLHSIGEFGVVLLVGGAIQGETKVLSVLLFEQIETLNYAQAHQLASLLVAVCLVGLLAVHWAGRRELQLKRH